MDKKYWETDGTRNGDPVYCPVNAYGDCPYCDQCNMCHIANPIEDCDDFGMFYLDWDEWVRTSDVFEIDEPSYDIEMGFNPYEGGYDYDC